MRKLPMTKLLRSVALLGLASLMFVSSSAGSVAARDAQAAAGVFVSSLTLQNYAAVDAIAAVRFITSTGGDALPNPYTVTVPAGGTALIYVPNVPGLADGKYSVVVDS